MSENNCVVLSYLKQYGRLVSVSSIWNYLNSTGARIQLSEVKESLLNLVKQGLVRVKSSKSGGLDRCQAV